MTKRTDFSIQKLAGVAFLVACLLGHRTAFSQNANSLTLVEFENKFDTKKVILTDAKLKLLKDGNNYLLKVTLGHTENQPTVKLSISPADLSGYLGIAMDIKNLGTIDIGVEAQCYNENVRSGSLSMVWTEKNSLYCNTLIRYSQDNAKHT